MIQEQVFYRVVKPFLGFTVLQTNSGISSGF